MRHGDTRELGKFNLALFLTGTPTDRGCGKCQTRGSMQGLQPMRHNVHVGFREDCSTNTEVREVEPVDLAALWPAHPIRLRPRPSRTDAPGSPCIGNVELKTWRALF